MAASPLSTSIVLPSSFHPGDIYYLADNSLILCVSQNSNSNRISNFNNISSPQKTLQRSPLLLLEEPQFLQNQTQQHQPDIIQLSYPVHQLSQSMQAVDVVTSQVPLNYNYFPAYQMANITSPEGHPHSNQHEPLSLDPMVSEAIPAYPLSPYANPYSPATWENSYQITETEAAVVQTAPKPIRKPAGNPAVEHVRKLRLYLDGISEEERTSRLLKFTHTALTFHQVWSQVCADYGQREEADGQRTYDFLPQLQACQVSVTEWLEILQNNSRIFSVTEEQTIKKKVCPIFRIQGRTPEKIDTVCVDVNEKPSRRYRLKHPHLLEQLEHFFHRFLPEHVPGVVPPEEMVVDNASVLLIYPDSASFDTVSVLVPQLTYTKMCRGSGDQPPLPEVQEGLNPLETAKQVWERSLEACDCPTYSFYANAGKWQAYPEIADSQWELSQQPPVPEEPKVVPAPLQMPMQVPKQLEISSNQVVHVTGPPVITQPNFNMQVQGQAQKTGGSFKGTSAVAPRFARSQYNNHQEDTYKEPTPPLKSDRVFYTRGRGGGGPPRGARNPRGRGGGYFSEGSKKPEFNLHDSDFPEIHQSVDINQCPENGAKSPQPSYAAALKKISDQKGGSDHPRRAVASATSVLNQDNQENDPEIENDQLQYEKPAKMAPNNNFRSSRGRGGFRNSRGGNPRANNNPRGTF